MATPAMAVELGSRALERGIPGEALGDGGSGRLAIDGGRAASLTHGGAGASAVPFMSTAMQAPELEAAIGVLKSGMLRSAKKCEELEARMSAASSAKHAMTCANGTCALQLAYEPLFKPGDDVLVPAWSYIATVSMVVARGARPVFVDSHNDTMQIDVADAARRLTRKTTAICATHLYGCPVDIEAVQDLANKRGLRVIYDAAQAHLATFQGRGIGAFGDAVTYSFYATKNLATGEGGMITCNDDALARQIKLLRSHGETDKYLHEQVGYNYRMNDIAGAIGCARLDRLESETQRRRDAARRYDDIISALAGGSDGGLRAPTTTPGAKPVYHLYVVKMDPARFSCTRDQFCKALGAEGVPTAVHYPRSLTRQPAFASFVEGADGQGHPPVADGLSSKVFALPMHHALTEDHFRTVEEALRKVVAAYRL